MNSPSCSRDGDFIGCITLYMPREVFVEFSSPTGAAHQPDVSFQLNRTLETFTNTFFSKEKKKRIPNPFVLPK